MQKGRNPRLIELRNQYLIKRRYFHYEVKRIRFDGVLEILSEKEIFLDQRHIMFIFRQNRHLIKEIKNHFEDKTPTEQQVNDFVFKSAAVPQLVTGNLFPATN